MPIYAYKCDSCGLSKDVLQKMSDPTLTDCPACGKSTFVKQLTAAGFQLKGSGWYATDFKGGSTSVPAAEGKSEGKTDAQSGAKTDTKADSSSDSKTSAKSDSSGGSDSKSTSNSAPASTKSTTSPAASGGSCGSGCACH